jgi:hypothetical protein
MAKLMLFGTALLLIALAPSSSTLAKDGFGNGGGYHRGGGDHRGDRLRRVGPAIVVVGSGDASSYDNNACAGYPGYDPASATYLGPDGSRRPC